MCFCRLNLAVNYVLFSVSCLTAKIIFTVRGDRGHSGDVLKCCRGTGERAGQFLRPFHCYLLPAACGQSWCAWALNDQGTFGAGEHHNAIQSL